jgi:hypothetical protein
LVISQRIEAAAMALIVAVVVAVFVGYVLGKNPEDPS